MSATHFKKLRKLAKQITGGLVPTTYKLSGAVKDVFLGHATLNPRCTRAVYHRLKATS